MSEKKTASEKELSAAKKALAAAQVDLTNIAEREIAASISSAEYSRWRAARDTAAAEVQRLQTQVASLEAAIERQRTLDAEAALAERVRAAKARNEALARRIHTDGSKIEEILRSLIRDIAIADAETAQINAELGQEVIVSAEFLARTRPGLPREDLKTEMASLWVYKMTGALVGDQSRVVETGPGSGMIPGGPALHSTPTMLCVKRNHRITKYRSKVDPVFPEPLASTLRLPDFAGPGVSWWDGVGWLLQEPEDRQRSVRDATREVLTEIEALELEPEQLSPMQEVFAAIAEGRM